MILLRNSIPPRFSKFICSTLEKKGFVTIVPPKKNKYLQFLGNAYLRLIQ